ncbi:MAG: hypothetical protein K0S08_1782 [Gammaproteobacteria bacterium]|jgi:hypothetical protein|nr:hypothetical protein [Gammaproteobacteria bacterium]
MKMVSYILAAVFVFPVVTFAETYQGNFDRSVGSGNLVQYHASIPKLASSDAAILQTYDGTAVAFSKGSRASKLLLHLANEGDLTVLCYKDYVIVAKGIYPFSSKNTLQSAQGTIKDLPTDQAKLLQINPAGAALMVG